MINTNETILVNPITHAVVNNITTSKTRLYIAVPFISSFAKKILPQECTHDIRTKRLITRFDETNINTFDIPTLQYLLDQGFEILYNNNIHLKLYITDNDAFITSSNLTKGGFENNIELSVKVDTSNVSQCVTIFDGLWAESSLNKITSQLLNDNVDKYNVLKKKQKHQKDKKPKVGTAPVTNALDIEQLLDEIFTCSDDYDKSIKLAYKANKKRNEVKERLKEDHFNNYPFYVGDDDPDRKNSLFYDFSYGVESKLAGTGLREQQFKDVFESPKFKSVIDYIFPESIGLEPWNFEDDKSLLTFCNGLFDFDIPQYAEAIPIRLASFFYPDTFLPIFKLNHLKDVCETLGLDTEAKSRGEKLYAYNSFLSQKMEDIPYDNYVKGYIMYRVLYSIKLHKRLSIGDSFIEIKNSFKKKWVKQFIDQAEITLKNIKAI